MIKKIKRKMKRQAVVNRKATVCSQMIRNAFEQDWDIYLNRLASNCFNKQKINN